MWDGSSMSYIIAASGQRVAVGLAAEGRYLAVVDLDQQPRVDYAGLDYLPARENGHRSRLLSRYQDYNVEVNVT
jgi:hypothetical protein